MARDFSPTLYVPSQAATTTLEGVAWARRFKRMAYTKDCLTQLEGEEGSNSVFSTRRELKGMEGRKINFHNVSRLGGSQTLGENVLQGNEESLRFGGYSCTIDYRRHAVALSKKLINFAVGGRTLPAVTADLLGGHHGENKQRDMLMTLRAAATSRNTLYANNAADRDALRSVDVLDTSEIVNIKSQIELNGAQPAKVTTYGKNCLQEVYHFILFADQQALSPLKQESNYLQAVQNADIRGAGNVQFTGEFRDWDGVALYNFRAITDDALAPVGSPVIARALLGSNGAASAVAAAAGNTNVMLYGGGENIANDTSIKYFTDFLGVPYSYLEEDPILSAAAGDQFLLVYNHVDSPAGGDKGKFGFYRYVASDIQNQGNRIETSERLSASNTTVGNVSFGSGPFAGKIAQDHPIGAPVFQANSYGVPIGCSLMLGADSAVRAYGQDARNITKKDDYDFLTGMAYEASFGQSVVKNRRAEPQNYGLIWHAITQKGIPFPTV